MTFVIEPSIPMPAEVRDRGAAYPFAEMKVTDSFFVPLGDEPSKRVQNRLRGAIRYFTIANEGTVRFTMRMMDGGFRIWRVA